MLASSSTKASKALLPTLQQAARRRLALAPVAGASSSGYHQASNAMPWTPPSASWWATRKRPSSSLGSLNYPHVAPDPLADPSVFDEINAYSLKRQTGVSLKTLLDTGRWVYVDVDVLGWVGGWGNNTA